MKILHTSDWHIGRKINDKNLNETLELFFDWLIETINTEQIDVLIVAGDVFNNPFPSNFSLSLYYKTLFNLSKTNLKRTIIIGGNHDSNSTLNAPQALLNELKISVIGGITENIEDLIIEVVNDKKELELVVCAVPYLREKDVRNSFSGNNFEQKLSEIKLGFENYYREISQKVEKYKQKNIPIIATGHLFINDIDEMSNEEKELFIGGLQELSYKQLPQNIDYYAFGHIHRPLKIGKENKARYCGSPIAMNFSENNYKHQVIKITFDKTEKIIDVIYTPKFRNLVQFEGTFDQIVEQIKNYKDENQQKAWCEIKIIEETKEPFLEQKIMELREKTQNIEIIELKYFFLDMQKEKDSLFKNKTSIKELNPQLIFNSVIDTITDSDKKQNLNETFNLLINNYLEEINVE